MTPHRAVLCSAAVRFVLLVVLAMVAAYPLHRQTYAAYFNPAILQLHRLNMSQLAQDLTVKFSYYLEVEDLISLQRELNAHFGLFGFVITDCTTLDEACAGQRILFASSPGLPWKKLPDVAALRGEVYSVLQGAAPLEPDRFVRGRFVQTVDAAGNVIGRQVLGRLYIINNIPRNFNEDFVGWLRQPFRDAGPHRLYLETTCVFVFGALLLSMLLELYLAGRRQRLRLGLIQDSKLRAAVAGSLKQLEEKGLHLAEQHELLMEQFSFHASRVRGLARDLDPASPHHVAAAEMADELESAARFQMHQNDGVLERTRQQMLRLQASLRAFEDAAPPRREETARELETSSRELFTPPFKQRVHEALMDCREVRNGSWLFIPHVIAALREDAPPLVADSVIATDAALFVLEPKHYQGVILPSSDPEGSVWHFLNPRRHPIRCPAGAINPYQQVTSYCAGIKTLLDSGTAWNIPVIGLIVFPDQADISAFEDRPMAGCVPVTLGRLCEVMKRITTAEREADPDRERPQPCSMEEALRGPWRE